MHTVMTTIRAPVLPAKLPENEVLMEDMALYAEKIDLQGMMQEYLRRYDIHIKRKLDIVFAKLRVVAIPTPVKSYIVTLHIYSTYTPSCCIFTLWG